MTQLNKRTEDILAHADAALVDVCAEFYTTIFSPAQEEEKPAALLFFLTRILDIRSDKTRAISPYFTPEECNQCVSKVKDAIDQAIVNLVDLNPSEDEFYEKLTFAIENETFFPTDREKICAIAICVAHPLIPYFHLGEAVRMEDSEYSRIGEEISGSLKKMYFILRRGYEQRTETASQLLEVLEQLSDRTQKIVFLAKLQGFYGTILSRKQRELESLQKPEEK